MTQAKPIDGKEWGMVLEAGRQWVLLVMVLVGIGSQTAHGQRNLKDIPVPDAELERRSFIVPEGFEVNLYAADPQIAKPIQMNFDAQGRLWIASSSVYPHIKPGEVANDKILIVEDRDGDGRAERTSVFADKLLIPTGVVPGDNGAYVVNSTELLHVEDTDGDGKADRRRVVLSGFGSEDTHHLLHTLRWGHDGSLYMNQSIYIHSHVETPYGVKRLGGGGIWRFRPDTLQLEVVCRGFVNPWGHHFDHWGQSFATDGAYGHGINYVFPGSVFVTAPGAKRFVAGLNPGSPKHCGLEIVGGRHLPADWQGNMITNDFRAHRVCRFVVTEDGAGYASRQETELIKSKHGAFRPIDVKMGPDGAIYIADWYNPIIQHGEVDFRDARRDHVHGRIWRVSVKKRPLVKKPKLVNATSEELLDALQSPEEWIRLHAKLQLKKQDPMRVRKALDTWLAKRQPDAEGYWHDRLEGLWVLQCLNTIDIDYLVALVSSPDHRVRAACLRVASQWLEDSRLQTAVNAGPGDQEKLKRLLQQGVLDEHPRVRLEAVRAWARIPSADSAGQALRVLDQPMDRFLDFALWQTMRDLRSQWLPGVVSGEIAIDQQIPHWVFAMRAVEAGEAIPVLMKVIRNNPLDQEQTEDALSAIASLGGPAEMGQLLKMATNKETAISKARQVEILGSLVNTSRQRKLRPAGNLAEAATLLNSQNDRLRAIGAEACGLWKMNSQFEKIVAMAGDDAEVSLVRVAAIQALAAYGTPTSLQRAVELAGNAPLTRERVAAVNAVASVSPQLGSKVAVQLLQEAPKDLVVAEVVRELVSRKGGEQVLVKALDGVKLQGDVAKLLVRAVRNTGRPAESLLNAIRTAGGLTAGGWKLDAKLMESLLASVQKDGQAKIGEAIYRRANLQCMKCHAIGGAGGKVGPDLVSLGGSAQLDYLVESLLLPNKKVKENFHALQVLREDGRVVSGVPVRQNKKELVLRTAEDKLVTIPVGIIEESRVGRSLMPDGTVDSLTREELVHLVRFLSELGKLGDFAVGKEQVARRWETLLFTREANQRLNRTSFDTAASGDAALQWGAAYSAVSGSLPVDALPRFQLRSGTNPTSFVRAELVVTTAGKIQLACQDPQGLSLWIDGRPRPLLADNQWELSRGRHVITLAIDRQLRVAPLRLELLPVTSNGAQVQWRTGK
jgi:putative heme-binding domain-containing protein